MRYTKLGRTGLTVSRMCLGTMNFGVLTDKKECFRILDIAVERGINFIDTANFYGNPNGYGLTEEIIGEWIKENPDKRSKVVLGTKIFATMGYGANDHGISALHIRQESENSLRRLHTDYIDLYQIHHFDRGIRGPVELANFGLEKELDMDYGVRRELSTPWEEIWQGMDLLVDQGKAVYIGSCNFPAWGIAHANGIARSRNRMGLVSEQSMYNLTNRMVELEVLPACRELGLGFMPYSPLASGVLGGILQKASSGRRSGANIEAIRDKVEAYENLCAGINEKPGNVALAWLLSNPVVTATIVGPRTAEQFESSLEALDGSLSQDTLNQLDKIWPGPGGEAPEAYSW